MKKTLKISFAFIFLIYLNYFSVNAFAVELVESPLGMVALMGGVSESIKEEPLTGIGVVGFRFIHQAGYPSYIQEVYPNSPASKKGILPKDLVFSIDGIPTAQLNSSEVYNLLSGTPGSPVDLTIVRANKKYSVNLSRVDLATLSANIQNRYLSGPVAVPFSAKDIFGY